LLLLLVLLLMMMMLSRLCLRLLLRGRLRVGLHDIDAA
jgi:hypothetical protein